MLHVQNATLVAHTLSPIGEWVSSSLRIDQSWRSFGGLTLVDVRVLQTYAECFHSLSDADRLLSTGLFALSRPGSVLALGEAQHLLFSNQQADKHASRIFSVFRRHPGSKRRFGRFHRRMQTMAERRLVAGRVAEEGEPEWRGRRRALPNPWDDFMIGSLGVRSWKRHRKTQWKRIAWV